MANNPLHQQVLEMRQSLFDEGFIDKQFVNLERLEDRENPNFAEEIISLFFRDSPKIFAAVHQYLNMAPIKFNDLEKFIHQLRGTSASIGACRLTIECELLSHYCRQRDVERCKASFGRVKEQHDALRSKLESYFQMARQVGPAEVAQRPK